MPILYLPYVTHPVDADARQSGLLLPVVGTSSTKGTIIGDSIYLVINRSMDATFGTQYFSKRGWSPSGDFRYRGRGEDFVNARFTALLDRGLAPDYLNQGGQDIVFSGRRDFDLDEHTRAVATGEYLSSFVYREAFAESFALAVASQVTSSAFITHNDAGRSASIRFDRYQNFEGITQVGNTYDTPQIRILHVPSLDFDTVDQPLHGTPVRWSVDGSAAGLSRSEPGYKTGDIGRFDLYPHLSLPLHLDGWTLRPEVGARETYYTQSQIPSTTTPLPGNGSVNRSDLEASFELRPPALVRDFKAPALERLFGSDLRHTIEPDLQYRYVAGVNNFSSIPRFDTTDVVSDTNEVEYSLTQRLFFKHLHPKPCSSGDLPAPINGIINVPRDLYGMRRRYRCVDYLEAGRKILLRPVLRGRRVSLPAQCAGLHARPHRGGFSQWAAQHFPADFTLQGPHQRTHGPGMGCGLRLQDQPDGRQQCVRRLPARQRLRQRGIFQPSGAECIVHLQPCQPGNEVQPAASTAGVWSTRPSAG